MNGRRKDRAERRVRRRTDFTFSLPFLYLFHTKIEFEWFSVRAHAFQLWTCSCCSPAGMSPNLVEGWSAFVKSTTADRWLMVAHGRNTSTCFSAYGLADKSLANIRESWWYRPENTRKNCLRKALDASKALAS